MFFELSRRLAGLPPLWRWCGVILMGLASGLLAVLLIVLMALLLGRKPALWANPGWIATVFAAVSLLGAAVMEQMGRRYRTWETARLLTVESLFENHELANVIGRTLGIVLRSIAEHLPEKADGTILQDLAQRAEQDWPTIARRLEAPDGLQNIPPRQWIEFVRVQRHLPLTDEQIGRLVKAIHSGTDGEWPEFADPASKPRVYKELNRYFGAALHQAFKRDFGRRHEMPAEDGLVFNPFFGPLFEPLGITLDTAAELIKIAAKDLKARGNEQAGQAILKALGCDRMLLDTCEAVLPGCLEALVQHLETLFPPPPGDDAVEQPHAWPTGLGLFLIAVLVIGTVLGLWAWQWYTRPANQARTQEAAKEFALVENKLREILAPRQVGEDPTQRQLPSELLAKVQLMLKQGSSEQRATAHIALKNDAEAALVIDELKWKPLDEAFRLLTLEGDNWYNAGEFDRALKPYEQALALQPENADAYRNAAAAHSQAKQGDIANHRQRTIELLTQGLDLVPPRSSKWSDFQNNLGLAWMRLLSGDRAQNMRRAIDVFRTAQGGYTRDSHPPQWAEIETNIGTVWLEMPDGDLKGNLQNAIASFQAAQEIYTLKEHPMEWAITQGKLAMAWAALPDGDSGENLARAVSAFQAALKLLDHKKYPLEWASIQNHFGLALDRLPTGNPVENRERAIAAFQAAGKAYSRMSHPTEWASTRFNQAQTLYHLARATTKSCDRLWQAIAYLKAAAKVWTPEAFPASHQNQITPLTRSLHETWAAQGCGGDTAFEGIPAAK